MARSALLFLNSGSWILNSPIRYGVFNGVGTCLSIRESNHNRSLTLAARFRSSLTEPRP